MIKLSDRWASRLVSQSETGMGYQRVSVLLLDGRRFENVVVVGGVIASVPGNSSVPFADAEIKDLVVTHGKPVE